MINVWQFDPVAANNNSAPPDGWPEGMARSDVNDAGRELMAAIARFRDDISGTAPSGGLLTVTGTPTAYALTTNQAPTALNNGHTVTFKVGTGLTNTGALTLDLDTLGAKAVQGIAGTALGGGELVAGSTYTVTFHSASNAFILHNFYKGAGTVGVPTGSRMFFQQTAAPTGWTKDTTHNDKTMRIVSGSVVNGGVTVFSSVFGDRTVAKANLPVTNLTGFTLSVNTAITVSAGAVLNNIRTDGTEDAFQPGGVTGVLKNTNVVANPGASITASLNNGTVTGTIPLGGSGTPMDFNVQYVDAIIATKN